MSFDEALELEFSQAGREQAIGDSRHRRSILREPAGTADAREEDRRVPLATGELDGRLESTAGLIIDVSEVVEA